MKPAKILETITPRLMRPKSEGGNDWGMPSPILMRQESTGRRLIWWPSSSYWSGFGGMTYSEADLQLVIAREDPLYRDFDREDSWYSQERNILSGGRFSRARALEVKDKIDEFFGQDVDTSLLNLKHTLVIE